MRLTILCTILSTVLAVTTVSYAAPTPMKVVLPLNVENITFESIRASRSAGVVYAKEQIICIHSIPTATPAYQISINSNLGGSEYVLTNGHTVLPIEFSWRTSSANEGGTLTPNQPLVVNNGGNSLGQCEQGSAAALRVSINGSKLLHGMAGHYNGQFSVVISPLA